MNLDLPKQANPRRATLPYLRRQHKGPRQLPGAPSSSAATILRTIDAGFSSARSSLAPARVGARLEMRRLGTETRGHRKKELQPVLG